MKIFNIAFEKLLGKHLEFRVRLFNVLAMAGGLATFIAGLTFFMTQSDIRILVIDWSASAAAFGLMIYAAITQKYVRCYYITVFTIFMMLFPYIFFTMGGFSGGMPFFFIFAIVFTAFMLENISAHIILTLELVIYICCYVVSFYFPNFVKGYGGRDETFAHNFVDFFIVAVSLASIALMHFSLYNRQQKELENAREEAEGANEVKSRFLANMSHEIRTPIGIALGMNEIILREASSEQIKGYARRVENAGRQLLSLVNNVLDVSAIEKGKLTITEEPYETAELVYSLFIDGEGLSYKNNLDFKAIIDESLPKSLTGDMPRIRQVASNFLGNAAKYTEQGGFTLAVSSQESGGRGEIILSISVSDTGPGVKAEDLPHLFDVFSRGDAGRYIEGSGLGLAIAKEYAESMGGRISVESEAGRGSVFTLLLTQKISDSTPMGDWVRLGGKALSDSEGQSFTAPGCAALVVDDNSGNRKLIKSMLAGTLMRIDTASSGKECLDMVSKHSYDVIFMDYMMPGMDGVEAMRRLKGAGGFDTPVFALTANVVAGTQGKLLSAGFKKYISKPIRWRDLESALLEVLPKGRVLAGKNIGCIPIEEKSRLSRELSNSGIILEDGLHYVDGDIIKYGKSALIFTENYCMDMDNARNLAGQEDWHSLKFCVHSLKSNAKNLGANVLSETALKIEQLCDSGDGGYISAILPKLYYEWAMVSNSLMSFNGRLINILPKPEKEPVSANEISGLLKFLKLNQYQNAMDTLENLIEAEGGPERLEKLYGVQKKISGLQFREAEQLLIGILESEV